MQNIRLPFPRSWRLADGLLHFRNRHFFVLDLLILSLTPLMALLMRVEQLDNVLLFLRMLALYTLCALLVRLPIFYRTGLYARYWRFASLDELVLVGAAVCLSSSLLFLFFSIFMPLLWGQTVPQLPRSIPLIDGLLALLLIGGNRLSVRLSERWRRGKPTGDVLRVAIVGAGEAGSTSLREIKTHPQLGFNVVGFFDDDPAKQGMTIHGVAVLGTCAQIPELAQRHHIDQILIALPSAPGKEVRRILQICQSAGIEAKMVPALHELLGGKFSVNLVRNVELEDLLRREPVRIDAQAVSELLRHKRVLVTGGGGSIGSELCRQILSCRPSRLTIVGHGENSVFEIHKELQALAASMNLRMEIRTVIADVRFPQRIRRVFQQEQPQVVFHAAAHKHVHLMEQHPTEAVINNILGTKHVLEAAQAVQVERFVMISTDKAVNPTSVMGATKRVAELLVHQAAKESGRPFVAVRFGNVLGSRGSVVLTFKQQIAAGGPVTVTHPEMVRYFMTIPEAVQLVLQAAVLGHGGEVFMLDMGQPVRIVDMARDLIKLSGLQEGQDIDIVFSGLRPGEKLYEEMFIPGEAYRKTVHEKLLIAANAAKFVPAELGQALNAFVHAVQNDDNEAAVQTLERLLPEYGARWRHSLEQRPLHRTSPHLDPAPEPATHPANPSLTLKTVGSG